jgi:hypothetical protein
LTELSGAKSGAFPPELTRILDSWLALPEAIRTAILSLVDANANTATKRKAA